MSPTLSQLFSVRDPAGQRVQPARQPGLGDGCERSRAGPCAHRDRVFSNSIISRNQVGPFGRGWWWSDGWQRTLSVLSDGTVVITDGDGSQRRFQPDLRGGYFDQPGDHATLASLGGGGYTLTEADGR